MANTTLHYNRGLQNEYERGITFRNDDEDSGSKLKTLGMGLLFIAGAAVFGTVLTLVFGQTSMTAGWQDFGIAATGIVAYGIAAWMGHPRLALALGAGPLAVVVTRQTVTMWAARTAQAAVDAARALATNTAATTPTTGTTPTNNAGLPAPGIRQQTVGAGTAQQVPIF